MADRGPLDGAFTGTGLSTEVDLGRSEFNLSISGGDGTVVVQRSFDGGATWKDIRTYERMVERYGIEVEAHVLYRLSCTVYNSGPIVYRIGTRKL